MIRIKCVDTPDVSVFSVFVGDSEGGCTNYITSLTFNKKSGENNVDQNNESILNFINNLLSKLERVDNNEKV